MGRESGGDKGSQIAAKRKGDEMMGKCIGCNRQAVRKFLCPCDLFHEICEVHDKDPETRKDCAFTHQWNNREGIIRIPLEV